MRRKRKEAVVTLLIYAELYQLASPFDVAPLAQFLGTFLAEDRYVRQSNGSYIMAD